MKLLKLLVIYVPCFPESKLIIKENLGDLDGSWVESLPNIRENFAVENFTQMSQMSYKSYDEIFDSIKKEVQESLNKESKQTNDSDSGTEDDLEWEFTVLN